MSTYDVGFITYEGDSDRIVSIEAMRRSEHGPGQIGGGETNYSAESILGMIRSGHVFTSSLDGLDDMIFDVVSEEDGGPYVRLKPDHPLISHLREIGERPRAPGPNPYR